MASPPQDLDALREKLKALGYLDAGVDRFVLAPARAGRRAATVALQASLRIGVLAGLALGVFGGLAAAAHVPGLVTGARDVAVLVLMLGLVFGTATCLTVFGVVWISASLVRTSTLRARLERRPRRWDRAGGLAVAVASLVYLTLWWGATTGGTALATPVTTALAILVILLVSVLLGHATATTVAALLASEQPDRALPRPHLPVRTRLALFLLGAGASAGLLALGAPGRHATDATAPTLTVRPSGLLLTVVAIDGFDPDALEGLGLDAQAPRLARLRGGRFVTFPPDAVPGTVPVDPVRVWTTAATGLPAARHGVTGMQVRQVRGLAGTVPTGTRSWVDTLAGATDLLQLTRPSVGVGLTRTAPTFWEVAASAGLRTLALNWWASWPALESDGVVLTERAVLRLEHGGALDREVAPASLYDSLRGRWPALAAEARHRVERWFPPEAIADDVVAAVRRAALVDAEQATLLRAVMTGEEDLVTIYLPGLDIAVDSLFGRGRANGDDTSRLVLTPGEASRRLQALRPHYQLLEHLLDDLDHPGRTLVLLASHGRWQVPPTGRLTIMGAGAPAAPATAAEPPQVSALDLAPTLLHALGVPVSRQLPGQVHADWFPLVATAADPVRYVAGYRARARSTPAPAPQGLDEEMRERLRSLGYVR